VTDAQDYDVIRMVDAVRRRLWIVLLIPALIAAALVIRNLTADFQTTFRASILLPGDTEIPGSSERPELMILDDLQSVVTSRAFAEIVATQGQMAVDDVEGSFESSRLGRVATITVKGDDQARVEATAQAAAAAFPTAINELMLAQGGAEATVLIIDPPGNVSRGDPDQLTVTAIATIVGLVVGIFAALSLDATAVTFARRASS
jgi:capsular polysaccharide biosynthesis protein